MEYLEGKRRAFTLPVDLSLITRPFQRSVLMETSSIPYGQVKTYRDIARAIGKPGAARAVGNALGRNPIAIVIPCHRVISSGGGLGGFMRNAIGGEELKRRLLELEGVLVNRERSLGYRR